MNEDVSPRRHLLALPAEIRMHILEYVFNNDDDDRGFRHDAKLPGLVLDDSYHAASALSPLLTCRQLCLDARPLAIRRTPVVCSNLFIDLALRLRALAPSQIAMLRTVAFVADARHFRALVDDWGAAPWGVASLALDELSIVLHRSSCAHYLFDFTAGVVRRLRVVRNGARVKGGFQTWYNRLVGLMLKVDHGERYLAPRGPCCEDVWWTWAWDDAAQSFGLEACPPKPLVDEESYLRDVAPLIEQLRISVEGEEWNPDPRSRNGA